MSKLFNTYEPRCKPVEAVQVTRENAEKIVAFLNARNVQATVYYHRPCAGVTDEVGGIYFICDDGYQTLAREEDYIVYSGHPGKYHKRLEKYFEDQYRKHEQPNGFDTHSNKGF